MATWKKIITSGSNAELNTITGTSTVTLTGLSDTSETKALMINSSNVVSARTLGDNAFNSTTIGTTTNALTAGEGLSSGGTFNGAAARTFEVDSGSLVAYYSSSIFGTVSGDATINDAGALTIANDAVEQAMIADNAVGNAQMKDNAVDTAEIADNAVSLAKMAGLARGNIIVGDASGDPAALDASTNTQILVGDGNDINSVAISGDISLANNGAVTIAANAVEGSMLNSNTAGDGLSYGSNELSVDLSGLSSVSIGASTSEVTIGDNLTVVGDLTVQGDTTTLSTTNTEVADQLMFLASGSAGTNLDAGLIVQSGSAHNSGSALYHDTDSQRWSVAKALAKDAASITPLQHVVTVTTNTSIPSGNGEYGIGEMHIDTDASEPTGNGVIYIRTA